VVAFYWAVNKRCNELAHHNVFLSGGGGQGFRRRRCTTAPRHRLLSRGRACCALFASRAASSQLCRGGIPP
jgi:hypothetical protein